MGEQEASDTFCKMQLRMISSGKLALVESLRKREISETFAREEGTKNRRRSSV